MALGILTRESDEKSSDLSGFLDEAVVIRGEFSTESTLHFDGCLEGQMKVGGHLVLGQNCRVDGSVLGQDVSVAGNVQGEVVAESSVEIYHSAVVTGELRGKSLEIHPGADVTCTCRFGE